MNRRQLLASSAAFAVALPHSHLKASDVDIIENRIVLAFRMLPMRPGHDGQDFPPTVGMDHRLQRKVWPENPDTYWDPISEDYQNVFGVYSEAIDLSAKQDGVSIWVMNFESYDRNLTKQTLASNGWKPVDDEFGILHYAGNDTDRQALADSLNMLGSEMQDGSWDWIGLVDDITIVPGGDEELVRTVSERVKTYAPMTTMDTAIHGLRYILPVDAYTVHLLPSQLLPARNAQGGFVCKTWTGDVPIIQSIGLRLDSTDAIDPMIDNIQDRLSTEISPTSGTSYADFLEITGTDNFYSTLRIDLTAAEDVWDVFDAYLTDDLGFLPPA